MKLLIYTLVLALPAAAQYNPSCPDSVLKTVASAPARQTWKLTSNKWLTGSLVVLAGASKGFNETLFFHWRVFERTFPKANPRWFNPADSWRNKYKNGNPNDGPKYPLSTSLLVMGTDQYHLDNFIWHTCWATAIVIKLGEPRKSLKYYLKDFLFYSFCHQLGFAATYYPFRYNKKKP